MNENIFAEYQPYIFLIIGLISIGFSVLWNSKKSTLKQTGVLVDGKVFEQGFDNSSNQSFDNSSSVKDRITVRFVTQDKEWITGVIKQDFQVFYTGQYKNGDTIQVYYDKDNPSNFYVDTKQSELMERVVISLAGLFFIVLGLYKLIA